MRLVAAFAAGAVAAGLTVYWMIERRGTPPARTAPESPAAQVPAGGPPTQASAEAPAIPPPAAAAPGEPKRAPRAPVRVQAGKGKASAREAASEPEPPPATPETQIATGAPPPSPLPAPAAAAPAAEPAQAVPPRQPHKVTLQPGMLITVRLSERLSSDQHAPGDAFMATLDEPLVADGFVIAERGAHVEGRVASVREAGRVKGVAALALQLVRIRTSDGQLVEISTDAFEKKAPTGTAGDAAKIGAGAAIGAAIGAIAGGGKGAAIGAGVGGAAGGGTVLATRGKPVVLERETRITFRLNSSVTIVEKL